MEKQTADAAYPDRNAWDRLDMIEKQVLEVLGTVDAVQERVLGPRLTEVAANDPKPRNDLNGRLDRISALVTGVAERAYNIARIL